MKRKTAVFINRPLTIVLLLVTKIRLPINGFFYMAVLYHFCLSVENRGIPDIEKTRQNTVFLFAE
ncbi:hypothetical protein [Tissierella sp.]|uniref:hypothetical protein n=1 Tax=Tissierella sp. TaxID=41274 RepID=UPI0028A8FD21|nr:hypothetical protein [Tissierella sp.]